MNILIVDDREDNRYLLQTLLKAGGHTVQSAANGAEALEILQVGGVELIVSDILMPVMDGFQLCRKVKTDDALRHIPFIVYTATYTGSKDEEFALKIGADRFIQKPCEPEVFMAAVKEVTAGAKGCCDTRAGGTTPEEEVLQLYNERLVRKLEQKMLQAEREIEARRAAESSLRKSEEKYRRFFENSMVGIFQSTPEGRFLNVNPTFVRMLGYGTVEELLSSVTDIDIQYWAHVEDRQRFQQILEKQGYVENFEFEARRKDGVPLWVSNSARVCRGEDGSIQYYEGIVLDIGERKRNEAEREKLQAQLLQAQKMESVGRLAGGVAHDFNNMLGVIIGYAELAMEKVDPGHPLFGDLDEILAAAHRSAGITRQLLAFARQQIISPQVINLNHTVDDMLKMLGRLIGEDIDLCWQPQSELWPVMMDPVQIDQILANLCVNARDAIQGVGKITIETGNTAFNQAYCDYHAGFVPGDFVRLAVSDDGCGMDHETLGKLFEPFFTTKPAGKGTGLGLATVFGIVKQNDGFINVYSEPGQGTTIKVYLPRHTGQDAPAGVQPVIEAPLGCGQTVLLVEDEVAILKLGRMMLESLGYRVLTAKGGTEALALAAAHEGEIRLLISDLVMPDMNGKDLAERLRGQRSKIKILFMSGYTIEAIAHRGVLDHGIHFIQKPFSRHELAQKVAEVLN